MFLNHYSAFSLINYEFNVLAVYGSVEYKARNLSEWQKLKVGDLLDTGDIVKLGNKSYLGLVHKSGKTIELTKSKSYKVSNLKPHKPIKNNDIINRLLGYILSAFGESNSEKTTYRKDMKGAATIERSIKLGFPSAYPAYTRFIKTNVTCFWEGNNNDNYEFRIFDEDEEILFETITKLTKLDVDLSKLKLNENQKYFWTVRPQNLISFSPVKYSFVLIDSKQRNNILSEINELKKNLNMQSPLDNFLLAGIYDYYELYYDSYLTLKNINKLAPGNQFYTEYFENWFTFRSK